MCLSHGLLVQSLRMMPVVDHHSLSVAFHRPSPGQPPSWKLHQHFLTRNRAERTGHFLPSFLIRFCWLHSHVMTYRALRVMLSFIALTVVYAVPAPGTVF